jgi:hypothetical protein
MILIHLKKLVPDRITVQRHFEGLINAGDELFQCVFRRGQEVNWDGVKRLVMDILWECNISIAHDDESGDDESPTFDESSFDEDEDSEESGTSGTTAGTGVQPANVPTTATTISIVPISTTIAPAGAATTTTNTATTTPSSSITAAPAGAATQQQLLQLTHQ